MKKIFLSDLLQYIGKIVINENGNDFLIERFNENGATFVCCRVVFDDIGNYTITNDKMLFNKHELINEIRKGSIYNN